jgi:hypothetical protein
VTKIRFMLTPLAAIAVATVPVFAAPPKESGPWDLMLVTPKAHVVPAAGMTREKCEEGLRLAVRAGHTAACARYIDDVKAGPSEEQRYSAFLYPVTTPAECATLRRNRNMQIDCVYR